MKKIFVLSLALLSVFALFGCKHKESREVSILSPSGSPALAQMYIEESEADYNYKIDIVQGADPLSAAFISKSYDFIYAPLNLGAKMYLNNANYKLLSVVVYCNYYLVYKGDTALTISDLANKKIVLFGENAVSGIIARMIFEENGLTLSEMDITYVNAVADAQSELIKDNSIVVLSSEPSLSVLESKISGLKTISMYDEYSKLHENENLPQAGIFVRSDIEEDIAKRYLSNLEASAKKVNKNIEESAGLGSSLYPSFTKEVLTSAIARSEINIVYGNTMKEECNAFFSILNSYNPNLIGGTINNEFYFGE